MVQEDIIAICKLSKCQYLIEHLNVTPLNHVLDSLIVAVSNRNLATKLCRSVDAQLITDTCG